DPTSTNQGLMCPPAWRGVTRRPTALFEFVRMPGRRQSDPEHQQIEGGGAPTNQMTPRQIDPSEPNQKKRVHRGGSFLCNDHTARATSSARAAKGKSTPAPIISVFGA